MRRTEQLISMLANDAGIIAQMGIFLAGAWFAITGKGVTAGVVIVFVQLMNYILNPISQVPLLWSNRKAAVALMENCSMRYRRMCARKEKKLLPIFQIKSKSGI